MFYNIFPDPVAFEDPKDETTEDLLKTTTLKPTTTEYDSAKPKILCSLASFHLNFVFNNHSQAQLLSNSYSYDDDDVVDDYDSYDGYDDTTTTTSTIPTPRPRDRDDDSYSYDSYEDGDPFNDSLSGRGNMERKSVKLTCFMIKESQKRLSILQLNEVL